MEIDHFSHDEHKLMLFDEEHTDDGKETICYGCGEPITGPVYSCRDCSFFLHKYCAELPQQVKHPLHRRHPLILYPHFSSHPHYSRYYSSYNCDFCQYTLPNFVYHCSSCFFNLHKACALLPRCIIEPESYDHEFILLISSNSFTCNACGLEEESHPIQCTICHILVHEKCMSLPHTITILHHDHTVIYSYFIQEEENDSFNWDCGICQEKVNTIYGSYYCQDCKFVVHVNCGIDNDISSEEPCDQQVDEDDLEPILSALKKIAAVDQNELQIDNSQFIHQHNLILVNETAEDKPCDGCILLISSSPFYKCEECAFTLHKSCIELPRQIKHRLDQHNLTLLPKASSLDPIFGHLLDKFPEPLLPKASIVNGIFRCSACYEFCHGFSYFCEYCDFKIDLRCASLSYRFKHDGHDHLINLTISDKYNCKACGSQGTCFFKCRDCPFTLDYRCATLPLTAKYWLEEHPLRLTYHNIDDGSDEYYCDICEEPRSPEYWYYYCAKCDYAAHPSCALSDYPFIKLGSTYTCDAHQHPLTFVRRNRNYLQCSSCNSKCKKMSLECPESECKFSLHWPDCVGSVIVVDGSRKIHNIDNPVLQTRLSIRMPSPERQES